MSDSIYNINVVSETDLPPPAAIKAQLPAARAATATVVRSRRALQNIIDGIDPRLFVVVGPCSIHDIGAAMEYAGRLKPLAEAVQDALLVVMRVYFEKPRTTVGWKGLINDPDMDDTFHMEKGIRTARRLLLDLADMGLPTATEALDPVMPQYMGDLISWTAIGARTTESQTHREMASGLSTPVGFKNGTDGGLQVAVNALKSARQPHHFLGINQDGRPAVIHTRGNAYGHIVLRGGGGRPNYDSVCIALAERALQGAGLPARIVVDCSHGNSNKDPALQTLVAKDCVEQVANGNRSIIGLMLESHLNWGNQEIPARLADLRYGVSVTDACIDWAATEKALQDAAAVLRPVVKAHKSA
ncbi:3-deoxy-7-phosphoheptulonate synthase [Gammaproteobacteria bacterium]|nr:3-deoxy-7-phosphoheptulonate synthase [Gammaproteobacteria bacterium]QOJ32143.1 MAG: 3-deoxy-7-phosphoheptulonate synthase [Gammaproteobacteria bacterium]CAG0945586.1 3-deoxy-7-phosphoheptulonate synthase [Gammaproteobacteria bacterium]